MRQTVLGADLGGASTYFFSYLKKAVLSRNSDQNMPENGYFFCKKI